MAGRRISGPRRVLVVALVWLLVGGSATALSGGRATAAGLVVPDLPDEVEELLADREAGGPSAIDWDPFEEPASADAVESEGMDPLGATELPEPGGSGPVEVVVAGDVDGLSVQSGDELRVEVLDHVVAESVGVSGFVFEVSDPSGSEDLVGAAAAGEEFPVELKVDYSAFAGLYGGGFVDRLQVVVLPACALDAELSASTEAVDDDPPAEDDGAEDAADLFGFETGLEPPGCDVSGVVLPGELDRESEMLVVAVEDLAGVLAGDVEWAAGAELGAAATSDGDEGVVFGVTSGVSGEAGTFAASGLTTTGEWLAGSGSGEFDYGYEVPVPVPAGGGAPDVGLSYSSGSVDGLTNASNPQASQAGLGWSDFDGAFIERRYQPCTNTDSGPRSLDLCWLNQNGTMSLGDVSGTLLPLDTDATEWAVHSDAGWKVERLTGADNGAAYGEHWKVTATDGTEYFFGLGRNPDNGAATFSTLTVPVFALFEDDPCWEQGSELHACDAMTYRWNLDRVVDPDGNVTTYHHSRTRNRYRSLHGFNGDAVYHRSSVLDRIEYGGREGEDVEPAGRVMFGRQYRCHTLNADCGNYPPTAANGLAYPDMPNDLICWRSSERPCSAGAPSFFSSFRYSHVRTEVRVGDEWRPVEQHNLNHQFRNPSGGQHHKLYLSSIQQNGVSQGGWVISEPTSFGYGWFANRADVDQGDPVASMPHSRITSVTNPHNGITRVRYEQNRPCAEDWRPRWWHDNDRDCFPQTSQDDGVRRVGVFHKWLVTRVTELPRGDSPPMVTEYAYEDDPAWAFNYGSFAQYDHNWGWSSWRGYGTTTVTQGDSQQRVRTFRGMEGDPLMVDQGGGVVCPCGHRSAEVETFDGAESFRDDPALAGRVLEEETYGEVDGQEGEVVASMLYKYDRRITHAAGSGFGRDAEWAEVSSVTERVATEPGEFRERGSTTTYDERLRPTTAVELGWLDEDEQRCTVTTYAENPDEWMFLYPASNRLVAGDCESGEVLQASEVFYDGSVTLGELGDRGLPTTERVQLDDASWAETTTEFDALGRPVAVTDPVGETSTTTYVAAAPNLIPTSTTTVNALGHEVTTDWLPEFGVPVREEDPNGNVTTSRYDASGRLSHVWLPADQPGGDGVWPSYSFSYFPAAADRKVRALQRTAGDPHSGEGLVYEAAFTFYDGFWRERQTQTQSPVEGHLIAEEITYDDRGQVRNETAPQAIEGTPGQQRVSLPADGWDNRDRYSYDAVGRPTRVEEVQNGVSVRESTMSYTHEATTVIDPEGNHSRERLDGFGRTVAVEEHDGDDWVTSSYGFDLADQLTTVADPEGNEIGYTYNMVGWRLTADDPNRGQASYGYDDAGRLTSTIDSEGDEIHVVYDALGRHVERRAGDPEGDLLASWEHDTAPGGIGLPHREVRPDPDRGGDWINEVSGYDDSGRPTGMTLTVPDGVGSIGGVYEFTNTYNQAGQVIEATIPEIGGLDAETITTGYDDLGYARSMTGIEDYVGWVQVDDRGRRQAGWYGPDLGQGTWAFKEWFYNANQMPERTTTSIGTASGTYGAVSDHQVTYDEVGNVTDKVTSQNGLQWRECFDHDARYRLTEAFTVNAADDCTEGTPGEGSRPYHHSYTYSPDGNLLERTEDGQATSYTYPAAGADRPHAPTSVDDDTYDWDANGNLTERTVDDDSETFTWDTEQRLTSVEGDDGGSTGFFYDASGQRLLRESDEGSTVYLAGHEITLDGDGDVADAVRPYSFAGDLVATRSVTQGVQYLVTDDAGSIEMAIDSGAETVAGTRSYDPYGAVRDTDGDDFATDRGFLGQVEDPTTNLSYLNERYYDTSIGVFLSTDPIYNTSNQRTLNPYSYAGGNPSTYADPTGLSPSYIYGLEQENRALHDQNSQLRTALTQAHGIIRNQQAHIAALRVTIRNQQLRIFRLMTRNAFLQTRVMHQQRIIRTLRIANNQLKENVQFLEGVARWQGAVIRNQNNTISNLQNQISTLQHTIYHLQTRPRPGGGSGGGGGNPKGGGSSGGSSGGGSGWNIGAPCPSGKVCYVAVGCGVQFWKCGEGTILPPWCDWSYVEEVCNATTAAQTEAKDWADAVGPAIRGGALGGCGAGVYAANVIGRDAAIEACIAGAAPGAVAGGIAKSGDYMWERIFG